MIRALAHLRLYAVAAAILVGASGCISLLPETQTDTLYRLEPADLPEARRAGQGEPVIIGRIAAPRGLSTDRIAIQRDGRIAYMAGAGWLSPAPAMVYSNVLDAFAAHAPAVAAARVEDGISARYALDLELRHFQAVYDNGAQAAPQVRVGLRARMIDRRSRVLIAARSVDATQRASANRQGAIVDAFSTAASESSAELADWAQSIVCDDDGAPAACAE